MESLRHCVEGKRPHERRAQVALVVKVVEQDGGRELQQVGLEAIV